MIIGVVASMTIPSLKKNTQQRENAVRAQKVYAAVANATDLLMQEYGPIKYWKLNDMSILMDEMYIKKLNVIKNCKNNGGCYEPEYKTYFLNGNITNDFQNNTSWYTFITADGAIWAYNKANPSCTNNEGTYIKNSCGYFEVDVNGVQKPNTMGIDIFGFQIGTDGVSPFGGCDGCDTTDCNPSGRGFGCTAKVLQEGKIDI